MNDFYPIYKSKLKPWIKYWLLKKVNGAGESTLKVVTISSGTLKKVDTSKSLSIKEYYGNTVQNGTPTPESPVEIKTISGENTFTINSNSYRVDLGGKNIFDKTTIVAGDIREFNTSTRLSSRQALWLDTGTYTMSTNAVSPFRYACSVQNVGVPPLSSYPTYILDSGWKTGNISYTFTLTTPGYFVLALSKTSGNITVDEVADFEYQLEEGNQSTEYSPYTDNPIELCKIGNYQDKLLQSKGNNKYYVEKNVGKVEIKQNGYISVQAIISDANKFIWRYASALNVAGSGNRDTLLCNYFVGDTGIWGNNNKIGAYINGSNQTNFSMLCSTVGGTTNNTKAELLSMLETWLNNNKLIMYYPLSTPTYTEITDTNLISQLNALYEFYVESSKVTISNNSEIPLEVLLEYYGR